MAVTLNTDLQPLMFSSTTPKGLGQCHSTSCATRDSNSGDLGRAKVRQRRKWFSRKYYASVMNIKEFYEDNIGRSFTGITATPSIKISVGNDFVLIFVVSLQPKSKVNRWH